MKQKGQSAVELAVLLPIFFTMCLGMIYGGMLFMDYLSLNNSARGIARAISLSDSANRDTLKDSFERKNSDYYNQITKLYTAVPQITFPDENIVKVEMNLELNKNEIPAILAAINFPPEKLKAFTVVMPIENKNP